MWALFSVVSCTTIPKGTATSSIHITGYEQEAAIPGHTVKNQTGDLKTPASVPTGGNEGHIQTRTVEESEPPFNQVIVQDYGSTNPRGLKTGRESPADYKRREARAKQQRAIALKAPVAVRQRYDEANAVYARAEAAFKAAQFAQAADLYAGSEALFGAVILAVEEKLRRAEQAMTDIPVPAGIGPVAVQNEPIESFRFIAAASLVRADFSNAPKVLIANVRDNKYFHESTRLTQEARYAFEKGDYDRCLRHAEEARQYALWSDTQVPLQVKIIEAGKSADYARVQFEALGSAHRYTPYYRQLTIAYEDAHTARTAGDWERTVEAVRKVMALLRDNTKTGSAIPVAEHSSMPAPGGIGATETGDTPQVPPLNSQAAESQRAGPGGASVSSFPDLTGLSGSSRAASSRGSSRTELGYEVSDDPDTPPVPPMDAPFNKVAAFGGSSGSSASGSGTPPVPDLSPSAKAPPGAAQTGVKEAPSRPVSLSLAAQYQVQPWNISMDCLWNIAGKPWVYGDSSKWVLLYYANISKLPNSENPNVIPPGIILDIPSVDGEARQGIGTWNNASRR
jgi:hypothetical protein